MPEPVELQPLHDAWIAVVNELTAFDARIAEERAALLARVKAANAAYAAAMPEGVPFVGPDASLVYFRRGDQVVAVQPHPIATPYTPEG